MKASSFTLRGLRVAQPFGPGNRVQWFRAEADMMRWQEEWERKLIEFLRTMRYFDKMTDVWASLAHLTHSSPGKAAVALKTSKRYQELSRRCADIFRQAGYVYRRTHSSAPNPGETASIAQTTTCQSEITSTLDDDDALRTVDDGIDTVIGMGTRVRPTPSEGDGCQILEDDTIIPFIQAARTTLNAALNKAIMSSGECN